MSRENRVGLRRAGALIGLLAAVCLRGLNAFTQNTVCAVVKLELNQQAALEREAFDAHLALNNDSADALQNLFVNISVADSDGNPAGTRFFVKVNSLSGTNSVDGAGVVQSSSTADIHWLIIPSTGAGGSNPLGQSYKVSASISFTQGGSPQSVQTFPASITVKPQPALRLEYVLPFDVFADQPLTTQVEPVEPFPLGVRVTNVGLGTARNFQIDQAQPRIIEDKQGLLIDFKLFGTLVGGKTSSNSLLVPFGDIPPGGAAMAEWTMATSLSGRFIQFTSTFTHAAELGGQLTSLVQSVTTYTLLKDVLVDVSGRDAVPDFLVNATLPRSALQDLLDSGGQPAAELILESDQAQPITVAEVENLLSGQLSGANSQLTLTLTGQPTIGSWIHTSAPLPSGMAATLLSARRADGKAINPRNVWISKHFRKSDLTTLYRLNLLDQASQSTSYVFQFNPGTLDQPPAAVTDLSAASAGPGQMRFTWTAPGEDGNGGAIVGGRYAIEIETLSSAAFAPGSAGINFATSTSPGAGETFLASGLAGNATFYARIWTQDAGGQISSISNVTASYVQANPPTGLVLAAISSGALTVSWLPGDNLSPIEDKISIATSSVGSPTYTTPFQGSSRRTFVFDALTPNTSYHISGLAMNPITGATSPIASLGVAVTSAAPPLPGAFTVLGNSSATANWFAGANPPDTLFLVQLSTAPDFSPILSSEWIVSNNFTFAGLAPSTTYYAQVKARSRAGIETSYTDLGGFKTAPVDAMPPRTSLAVASPQYGGSPLYVTTTTILSLTAVDDQHVLADAAGLGVAQTFVSIDSGAFAVYGGTFALADPGLHNVSFYSVDAVGNAEVARSTQVAVDIAAPDARFSIDGSSAIVGGTFYIAGVSSIALAAQDPLVADVAAGVGGLQISVDGASISYSAPFTLAAGSHTVGFGAFDHLGNGLDILTTAAVTVDALSPRTALAISTPAFAGAQLFLSSMTPMSLSAEDDLVVSGDARGSGVAQTLVSFDSVPYTAAEANLALPAEGVHTLSWRSLDFVGNSELVRSTTIAIDATAPQSSLVVIGGSQAAGPDTATFYASSDTRVAFLAADPPSGGVASGLAVVRYQDNSGQLQDFLVPLALGEGRHALRYQSQDNVLNLEVLRSTTVLVDATPPATTVSIGAPTFTAVDGAIYAAPTTSVAFTGADPALASGEPGSGVERVEASVAEGVFSALGAPLSFSEGFHTIRYRAIDRVGNVEAERTLRLRSDATPPVSVLAVGEPSFQLSSATVLVSSTTPLSLAAQDPTVSGVSSGVKETVYRVFGEVSASTAPFQVFTAPFAFSGADGSGTVEFYSRDQVLNAEPVRSRALILDTTPPQAVIASPRGGHGICSVIEGTVPVRGTAQDLHFASYLLEAAPGRDAAAGFVLVSSGAAAVDAGLLGTWDARGVSGWQTLRLTVIDQVRNASVSTLSVFVGDPGRLMVLGNHETFNMPQGVAAGADGRIYVADTNDDRVQVFSATGTALAAFGRLNKPKGVAVDATGAIYVADTHNDRVLKLSATGQILLEVGRRKPGRKDDDEDGKDKGKNESQEFQSGKGPGEFRKPSGIAVDGNGNIFVADTDNNRVQKLGPDGAPLLAFNLPAASSDGEDDDRDCESPELGRPVGIALDGAGNIYVADPRGARALKFSPAGQLLMTLPVQREGNSGKPGRPEGIAVSPDGSCVLVSDQGSSRVIKFDAAGVQTLEFGQRGKIKDNRPLPKRLVLRKPAGLALGADGKLYVADRNNDRIQVFWLPTGEPSSVVPPSAHDHDDEHVARDVVDREDGGLVERDDRAGVIIPAGALAEDLKITVSTPVVAVESDREHNRDDQDLKVVSAAVEYGPEGTKFKESVTLVLPYTRELIAAQGVAEDSLKINYWNKVKGEWEALESEVDKKNGTVKAKTPHFSLYQVLGSTGAGTAAVPLAVDASFGFKDMYAFPSPVRGRGPVTIRIQPGLVDLISVRVYDVSGRKIHESSNFTDRGAFDDGNGKGAHYTYDHVWDVSGVGSGVYIFVVTAAKGGERDIHKTGKVGIIK